MSQLYSRSGALLSCALVLSLAACSDNTDPSDTDTLSDPLIEELGQDVTEEVGDMLDASVYDPSTGVFLSAAPGGSISSNTPPPACVTLSPLPPPNSDGDIVPDSVRFDYTGCGFSRAGGQLLDSLSGTIDHLDPQPTVQSLGVRFVFSDFTRKRINVPFPRRSFIAVHNGVREWGGNADTLGHTITGFRSVWTHLSSGRTATHEKDWVGKFTATTPGTIGLGIPLPAGALTVNGTSSWETLNRTWSIQTTTTEALQFDPACQVPPRFTDGTLNLVVTRRGVVTNVEIVFLNCGQYQVTRTPGA